MLRIIPKNKHKKHDDYQGVESYFHFSNDKYYAPSKINYGVIYGLNDYTMHSNSGLAPKKNQNVEVLTYVYEGHLTHVNSMNHVETFKEGSLNYLSAGTGVLHSERNATTKPLKMVTFYALPNQYNTKPEFQSLYSNPKNRKNQLTKLIGNHPNDLLSIKQDLEVFVCDSDSNQEYVIDIKQDRQAYIVCLKGSLNINGKLLESHDSAKVEKTQLTIQALEKSTFMILEMCLVIDQRQFDKSTN